MEKLSFFHGYCIILILKEIFTPSGSGNMEVGLRWSHSEDWVGLCQPLSLGDLVHLKGEGACFYCGFDLMNSGLGQ